MIKIGAYIQRSYAKKTYKVESYNVRKWYGLEMIRDALQRHGFEVGYCEKGTVTEYDIILVSITALIDWYSFISERVHWPKGKYKVIVGGAGVTNIRPFLEYADVFVFGRGEDIIIDLIQETAAVNKLDSSSVCYSEDFSPAKSYTVSQTDNCYPYPVRAANDEQWQERAIGCRRKCLFCEYSWTRQFVATEDMSGDFNRSSVNEGTIWDFDLSRPETWTTEGRSYVIVGVDGCSERLRFLANKPIKDDFLEEFIISSAQVPGLYRVKMFNIVGYPTETEEDWLQILDVFERAGRRIFKYGDDREYYVFEIVSSHFDAMPCTPFAVAPGMYQDLRWRVADTIRRTHSLYRHKVLDTGRLRVLWQYSTETLPTVTLKYAVARGIEQDAQTIRLLSCSKRFWRAPTAERLATTEKYLDIDRLFRAYRWDALPTRYLNSYVGYNAMAKLTDTKLRRYGGAEGVKIADYVVSKE